MPDSAFSLQDETGEFLEVEAERHEEESLGHSGAYVDVAGEETESLRAQLEAAVDEIADMRQQTQQEKTRFREQWRTNCQCLAEYDDIIARRILRLHD